MAARFGPRLDGAVVMDAGIMNVEDGRNIYSKPRSKQMTNGFDKYLEYQYGWSGDFYRFLVQAIQQADTKNSARLAQGFPEEVEAYHMWSQVGVEEFAQRCSQDHPLLARLKEEYALS